MKTASCVRVTFFASVVVTALAAGGCGGGQTPGPPAGKPATPAADSSRAAAENWCIEHGVPEDICGRCSPKAAAECQRKGDWCKGHNRPQSQCFLCRPELQATFAAEYEAKYGKKPPTP